jgi:hypothetical protein
VAIGHKYANDDDDDNDDDDNDDDDDRKAVVPLVHVRQAFKERFNFINNEG